MAYKQNITYIKCCKNDEDKKLIYCYWDPIDSWKSLTDDIDVISLPCSHFELLDIPYAEICSHVILTTAVFKYRSHAPYFWKTQITNHEKQLISLLKDEIVVVFKDVRGKIFIFCKNCSLQAKSEVFYNFCLESIILKSLITLEL